MMLYTAHYNSPFGNILLESDGANITGLRFEENAPFPAAQKAATDFACNSASESAFKSACKEECNESTETESLLFADARRWLDIYFSGANPPFTPPFSLKGSAFQLAVWKILCEIPYGKTASYSEIAALLSRKKGGAQVSARAVGAAAARNPVSIIVPCHRVIGKNGALTGYAGGLERKKALLELEGALPVSQGQTLSQG